MEELWKMAQLDFCTADVANRAEYEKLVKRFHAEEERAHRDRLLYGGEPLTRTVDPQR